MVSSRSSLTRATGAFFAVLLTKTVPLACAQDNGDHPIAQRDFRPGGGGGGGGGGGWHFSYFSADNSLACCPDGKPKYGNETCCRDGFTCDTRNSTGSGPICIEIPPPQTNTTKQPDYITSANLTEYTNTTSTNTTSSSTNTTGTNTTQSPISYVTLTIGLTPTTTTTTKGSTAAAFAGFSRILASVMGLATVIGVMSI